MCAAKEQVQCQRVQDSDSSTLVFSKVQRSVLKYSDLQQRTLIQGEVKWFEGRYSCLQCGAGVCSVVKF